MAKKVSKAKSKNKRKSGRKASPKSKAAKGVIKIEMDLNVRSEHPSLPAPAAVDQIRKLTPGLTKQLKEKYKAEFKRGRIQVARQKTFPVDPATIVVTIMIYVGMKVVDKVIEKLTEDVYDEVKKEVTDASVTRAGESRIINPKWR
jgi:hypothetical protein